MLKGRVHTATDLRVRMNSPSGILNYFLAVRVCFKAKENQLNISQDRYAAIKYLHPNEGRRKLVLRAVEQLWNLPASSKMEVMSSRVSRT
jgi:hypothetical protein